MSWRARATCGKAFPIASSCVALTAQQRRLQRVSAHSLMCMCSQRHGTLCCSMRLFCVTSTCVRLQSWRETHVRAWMCSKSDCRVVNKATDPRCAACGEAKPNLLGWKCEVCATRNFSGVKLCKQCKSSVELSREMWMCSSCGENNRIDELEDNSLCGFCGYDMAPLSASAEALLRESQEESERRQAQQESFDQISPRMADEQVGNELAGAEVLPSSLQRRMHAVQRSPKLVVKKFEPFTTPKTMGTSHSKLRRMVDRAQRGQTLTSNAPAGPPGFDWMCRAKKCQHISPGDEEVCMQCAAPFAAEDWECPHCAAINHKSRSRCFSCDAPIPVSWSCTKCEGVVSIYDKTCCHCETERPPAQPKGRRDAQASFGAGAGRQRDSERGDWYCEACSAMNFGRRTECFQCRNPRPESATSSSNHRGSGGGGSVERSSSGHNNWKCAGCQSSNFRTRTTCWQCGMAPASEAHRSWSKEHDVHFDKEGFQDAPDSKPAEGTMNTWRKTDDWTCAKCFAKNFRTRGECHKCGSLKISVSPKKVATRRPVKI